MTNFTPDHPSGATPLDPNEIEGLIPTYISTQGELNSLEQENIIEAETWLLGKTIRDPLDDFFLRDLHKRMFCNVWQWAGKYRKTEKNIGDVPPYRVAEEIRSLGMDARQWIESEVYEWDELAARFHHRLVWIHAFPNGNGRHARTATDVLLRSHGQRTFSWGRVSGASDASVREKYIQCLRSADRGSYGDLIKFVRS